MKKTNFIVILMLILSVFVFYSCKEEVDEPVAKTTTYDGAAAAIINTNCAISGCHVSGAAAPVYSMAGYADAKTFASFGKVIGSIKREAGFKPMPYGAGKLSDADISVLEDWIADGSLEK